MFIRSGNQMEHLVIWCVGLFVWCNIELLVFNIKTLRDQSDVSYIKVKGYRLGHGQEHNAPHFQSHGINAMILNLLETNVRWILWCSVYYAISPLFINSNEKKSVLKWNSIEIYFLKYDQYKNNCISVSPPKGLLKYSQS